MKNLILMAREKAERLTDKKLAEEIEQLQSGKRKLRLRDEQGRPVPLNDIILAVFKRIQEERTRRAADERKRKRFE